MNIQQAFKSAYISMLFLILSLPSFSAEEKDNCILVINSYTEMESMNDRVISTLLRGLPVQYRDLPIGNENMIMLLINDEQSLDAFKSHLFESYEKLPPKVIILEGNSAWALLHEDIEKRWKDVPIILCAEKGYTGPREAYLNKRAISTAQQIPLEAALAGKNVVVVPMFYYMKETISLMKKLQPNIKRLAFISDRRWINAQNRKELKETVQAYFPELAIDYYTAGDLSTNELIDRIETFDDTTGILFSSWFVRDLQTDSGSIHTRGYRLLARHTERPIFCLSDVGVNGRELIGGYFSRLDSISSAVLQTTIELLSGKEARFLGPRKLTPLPVFNYEAFMLAGLSKKACPSATFFYEKPESFFEKYKYPLGFGVLFVVFLLVLTYFRLLAGQRLQKSQVKELNSMRRYDHLFNNMPIAYLNFRIRKDKENQVAEYDLEGANPAFRQLFLQKEEANMENFSWRVDPERRKVLLKRLNLVSEKRRRITFQYHHPETKRTFTMLLNPTEEEDKIEMFCVDNTELGQAQQLLRSVNHKLTMALEVANLVPWKWDLENNTILCDVNRPIELAGSIERIEEQLSVPDQEYFSKICKEDRERVRKAYQDLILGKVSKIKEEYRVLTVKNGQRAFEWVEAQATVDQRDEHGAALTLIGSSQVISDRKQMERDLISAKDQAEEANRLKSAFLANMSHEIRTPLNAIIGFSGILASTKEEEEKQEYMSIIESNNTLLLQLINDILDLSKIEAGTLEFSYSNIDLNDLLREIERTSRQKPGAENLTIEFEKSIPDCFINTEKHRLMQVITNFISNAIKFTNEGSIRFGYELDEKNFLRFYVTDTGCGIPQKEIGEVFGRFVKLNNFVQGTGLGLSICETIVRNMRGTIGVDSEEGVGSTFWFAIPYRPVKMTEKQVKEYKQITVSKSKEERLTILIAEDNASNYRLLESIFREEYELLHAWNGREAVELYTLHRPEMILMDINMPEMNGYEATKAIRELSDSVPIIALTAYAFASDEERILNSGFDAYTPKPLDANRLRRQLNELQRSRLLFL